MKDGTLTARLEVRSVGDGVQHSAAADLQERNEQHEEGECEKSGEREFFFLFSLTSIRQLAALLPNSLSHVRSQFGSRSHRQRQLSQLPACGGREAAARDSECEFRLQHAR